MKIVIEDAQAEMSLKLVPLAGGIGLKAIEKDSGNEYWLLKVTEPEGEIVLFRDSENPFGVSSTGTIKIIRRP